MKKLFSLALLGAVLFSAPLLAEEQVKLPDNCKELDLDMISCPLAEDVSMDDAAESMKLRANMLNFKLVAHMPLSEQVKAMGGKSERMEIFQFCDATIAARMVAKNLAFAGFLPCRIALVSHHKKPYIVTINMDKTLGRAKLPPDLQKLGLKVRNSIYSIISAGANGDL